MQNEARVGWVIARAMTLLGVVHGCTNASVERGAAVDETAFTRAEASNCADVDSGASDQNSCIGAEDGVSDATHGSPQFEGSTAALTLCLPWSSVERFCDGQDDDCDGWVDEFEWAGPCATACGAGVIICDPCFTCFCTAPTPVREVCDFADNDCDGRVDEGQRSRCDPTSCVTPPETCDGRDNDCDGRVDENWDFRTNPMHCGGCNQRCSVEEDCVDGSCELDPTYPDCPADRPNCSPF
jgi:hypothetical protein